ncbi:GGDEF domain-containing protein [Amorphus sp. MBR-141]
MPLSCSELSADDVLAPLRAAFDLTSAPILLVSDTPLAVLWVNRPVRRLLGEHRLNRYPASLDAVFGSYVAREIGPVLAPDWPVGRDRSIVLDCLVAAGKHRLAFSFCPTERAGVWVLTLTDSALPPDGAWRHDIIEILDLLPVGVEIYSRDLEAMFFNKFSDALFNYDGRAITHFDDWWEEGFPDPRERAEATRAWQDRLAAARADPETTQSLEFWVRCWNEERRCIEFRLRVIREKLVLIELDVTDQRIMEAELRHIGSIDTLTDTANRRAFMERAERVLADARAAPAALSVLMIDIDHFKSINDRFGHSTGDEVLVAVATRIRANLREEEVLARIGGEEFAIALPGIAGEAARAAADRVRTAICGSSVASAIGAVDVTVSIGATEYAGGEDTVEDLLRQADQALYEAKARGRNCVVWAVAGG